jgi:hypothetical protein
MNERPKGLDAVIGVGLLLLAVGYFVQEIGRQPVTDAVQRLAGLGSELLGITGETMQVLGAGALTGWLMSSGRPEDRPPRARALAMGVLLVLTVGQLVLRFTEVRWAVDRPPLRSVGLTAVMAIGVLLTMAATWHRSARGALTVAGTLYLAGWLGHLHLPSTGPVSAFLVEALTGPRGIGVDYGYAILQWTAVMLVGGAVGISLATFATAAERSLLWLKVAAAGLVVLTAGVAIRGVSFLPPIRRIVGAPEWLSLFGVFPAAPTFLLCFGGLALMMVAGVALAGDASPRPRWVEVPARLGQAGFITWVVQSFVYRDLVARLDLTQAWTWPLVLTGSLALVWLLVRLLPDNERPRVFQAGTT